MQKGYGHPLLLLLLAIGLGAMALSVWACQLPARRIYRSLGAVSIGIMAASRSIAVPSLAP